MVYLWRAVDAEGEVLDVLVQSKRIAALKLMRKLLKKYAFAPERLVTDDLRSYGSAARDLGLESRRERGRWKNNRAGEFTLSRPGGGSARCSGSRARVRPRKFLSAHAAVYKHLQRVTSSHRSPNAPRASRRRNGHVADRARSRLTIPEPPMLRARRTAM